MNKFRQWHRGVRARTRRTVLHLVLVPTLNLVGCSNVRHHATNSFLDSCRIHLLTGPGIVLGIRLPEWSLCDTRSHPQVACHRWRGARLLRVVTCGGSMSMTRFLLARARSIEKRNRVVNAAQ
jgi:hypothetical protein